jgi:hypothetical protein
MPEKQFLRAQGRRRSRGAETKRRGLERVELASGRKIDQQRT